MERPSQLSRGERSGNKYTIHLPSLTFRGFPDSPGSRKYQVESEEIH